MTERVRAGDLLDDKYLVERIIGEGGAGYVAAARHVVLQRRVALKFLRPELACLPELRERFLREARAAARIQSDHVARVLDADTLATGQPYLVMEYLEGEDVAAAVRQNGPFAVADAVDCLLQACRGLEEAHRIGIIHRDIKPSNLFLARAEDGRTLVKVLDFGLSKAVDSGGASLTDENHVVGSPHFMSPEQIRTPCEVDERTDVWSLGATLFTMLAGRVPFEGRSLMEVCGALLCGPAPRIARSDVPPEVEAIVLRCLSIEPGERFASVPALAQALASAAGGLSTAPPPSPAPPPRAEKTRRRSRYLAIALAGAGLAVWSARGIIESRMPAARSAATPTGSPAAVARVAAVEARPLGSGPAGEDDRAPEPSHPAPSSPLRAADDAPQADARPPSIRPPGRPAVDVPAAAPSHRPADRAASGGPAPAPSSSCSQPFYIDARGIKAIRPECL
jgi:serine/threonine-protein kinase